MLKPSNRPMLVSAWVAAATSPRTALTSSSWITISALSIGLSSGEELYDNVRKFIQFQLTINVVLCFITILGGATVGHPPLNVVQMLWCNLIMDVLGAIALGTEPYRKDQTGPRISRKDFIMNPELWR